jgi:hypothetical protein
MRVQLDVTHQDKQNTHVLLRGAQEELFLSKRDQEWIKLELDAAQKKLRDAIAIKDNLEVRLASSRRGDSFPKSAGKEARGRSMRNITFLGRCLNKNCNVPERYSNLSNLN